MSEETYAALWPRGEKTVAIAPLAPRLETLAAKTVAFLWITCSGATRSFQFCKTNCPPLIRR